MPISKMYIGQCQNWPHFQPDADGWTPSCGFEIPAGAPLAVGVNPEGNCGAQYGDYGWFSSTDSLTGSAAVAVVWDGNHIHASSDFQNNMAGFTGYDPNNTNSNLVFRNDQPTTAGYYTGYIYQRYGPFTKIADRGWMLNWQNLCGSSTNGGSPIYASCVRRTPFEHICPTNTGTGLARHMTADCGLPYGNGWFHTTDYSYLVINYNNQTIWDGAPLPGWNINSVGARITIDGYDYVKSGLSGCSAYLMYNNYTSTGWVPGTCGEASGGGPGYAFGYTRHKTL